MSLEASIVALTAAMVENTEVQRALLAKVDGAEGSFTSASSGDIGTAGGERERGKPAPGSGRTRRTKEEIAEDEAAIAAETGTTTTTAATKSNETTGVSFDELKTALGGWLGEFAKAEDKTNPDGTHPEVTARRDALKKVLVKITANDDAKLPMLAEDPASITRLHDWLEKTAKNADKGHGIGRLAADPAQAAEDDDELGV